jgi:urease accessory protein
MRKISVEEGAMKTLSTAVITSAVLTMAVPALAHTGAEHGASFAAGVLHPLAGLDHLVVMAGIGAWAAALGGRALWLLPLSFLTAMSLAAVAAVLGVPLPGVEVGIVLSVIAIVAALLFKPKASLAIWALIAAVMAVFHGHAHGAEMPAAASLIIYGGGFVLGTAILHAVGAALALALRRGPTVVRTTA